MTAPLNPPGYDVNSFSPSPRYRETSAKEIVDNVAGFEPPATEVYRFRERKFAELHPYDDIP